MIYEKSCGAVIYAESGGQRVYLIEQMKKGHHSICKGHMEAGESEHRTAAREIREETGLTVTFTDGFREVIRYSPYAGCMKTVVFFLARAESTNTTAQEEEVSKIYWLPFEKAMAMLNYDSDREVLLKAESFLNGL